MIPHKI
jgi:hypothetical protein